MIVKALASGSNGNCILVKEGETTVLIDAGISCKRITGECEALGLDPGTFAAVLVTHEHSDHISGLPVFAKRYRIPICGTEATLREVADKDRTGSIDPALYRIVRPGRAFTLGSLSILPFSTFHDAADPVAYRLNGLDRSFAVLTDTGKCSDTMIGYLQNLSGILLETNHDIRMLEAGSYPYVLKRRILSDYGHLSNEYAGNVLLRLMNPALKTVLLGHISEENNYPDIALMEVLNTLKTAEIDAKKAGLTIVPLLRTEASACYNI